MNGIDGLRARSYIVNRLINSRISGRPEEAGPLSGGGCSGVEKGILVLHTCISEWYLEVCVD